MSVTIQSMASDVLTKLNTRDGGRWTSEEAQTALQSACRDIMLTPAIPNVFFLGVSKLSDTTREDKVGDDGTISLPSDILRLIMVEMGIIKVFDVQPIDQFDSDWMVTAASTISRPRVIQRGGTAKLIPSSSLAGLSYSVYYIPEAFAAINIPSSLRESLVYRAASILAESGREFATAKFLRERSDEQIANVVKSV